MNISFGRIRIKFSVFVLPFSHEVVRSHYSLLNVKLGVNSAVIVIVAVIVYTYHTQRLQLFIFNQPYFSVAYNVI